MPRTFDTSLYAALAAEYGTPLYVYDVDGIEQQINNLRRFDVIRYAQKANSNLSLLRWLHQHGVLIDAVSAWEVHRAISAGFSLGEIALTSDLFDHDALDTLRQYPVNVNIGSADMLEQYAELGIGSNIMLRINPGFGHGHDKKVNTGGPESKHGIWHEQLPDVVRRAERAGLQITGLHMHIGSGSDFTHLGQVREAMIAVALTGGDNIDTISVGGGLPTPYRPTEQAFNSEQFVDDWMATKSALEDHLERTIRMEVEPGRYLVAECGVLLTEVRGSKSTAGFDYILVDAGFNNMIRPAMYGAYHHITILGKTDLPTSPRAVAGPICESADVFTQEKGGVLAPVELPEANIGDIVCIHDAGAYTSTMASNYNTRPLAAEVMIESGQPRLVRKRQTYDELIANEVSLL